MVVLGVVSVSVGSIEEGYGCQRLSIEPSMHPSIGTHVAQRDAGLLEERPEVAARRAAALAEAPLHALAQEGVELRRGAVVVVVVGGGDDAGLTGCTNGVAPHPA